MNEPDKWAEARRKALADIAATSDEEDARITTAALADPDAQPWTDEMWSRAITYDEWKRRRADKRAVGVACTPELVLPIDAEVIEHFRKTGQGWEWRLNAALRKAAGLR